MALWDKQHLRAGYTFHAVWCALWTLALILMWLLSTTPDMAPLWLWPSLLCGNVLMIFISLGLLVLVAGIVPSLVVVAAVILNVCATLLNLLALIWFSIVFDQCIDDVAANPLCTLRDYRKLGIGYLIAVGAFLIGNLLFFAVAFLTHRRTRNLGLSYGSAVSDGSSTTMRQSAYHFIRWAHTAVSVAMFAASMLVIEISYLSPYSIADYLWLAHVAWPIPAVAAYLTLAIAHKDRIFAVVSLVAALGSSTGVALMAVYYQQLCIMHPVRPFAGMDSCDLTRLSAQVYLAFHCFLAALAWTRVGAYVIALFWNNGASASVGPAFSAMEGAGAQRPRPLFKNQIGNAPADTGQISGKPLRLHQ